MESFLWHDQFYAMLSYTLDPNAASGHDKLPSVPDFLSFFNGFNRIRGQITQEPFKVLSCSFPHFLILKEISRI